MGSPISGGGWCVKVLPPSHTSTVLLRGRLVCMEVYIFHEQAKHDTLAWLLQSLLQKLQQYVIQENASFCAPFVSMQIIGEEKWGYQYNYQLGINDDELVRGEEGGGELSACVHPSVMLFVCLLSSYIMYQRINWKTQRSIYWSLKLYIEIIFTVLMLWYCGQETLPQRQISRWCRGHTKTEMNIQNNYFVKLYYLDASTSNFLCVAVYMHLYCWTLFMVAWNCIN